MVLWINTIASKYSPSQSKWIMPQPLAVSMMNTSTPIADGQPVCSNQFLQEYLRKHHSYPDTFKWHKMEYFQINDCAIPKLTNLSACLKRLSLKKVVLIGDSQGNRYVRSFMGILRSQKYRCTERPSRPTPKVYSVINLKGINATRDKCSSCKEKNLHCVQAETKATLDFKYVELIVINGKLEAHQIDGNTTISTKTFLEFLFKIYFRSSFPDLILFEIPFNHVKRSSVEEFEIDLRSLMAALKSTMKPNTKIVLFPGLAEHESKRPKKAAAFFNKKYHGSLATEQIYKLTRAMWNVLEDDLVSETSNIMSHANFVNATKAATPIVIDGVHYKPQVYAHIMRTMLATMCFE
ncbi:hypothetical protein CAPTEDRAFT_189849 [Capitella teleta]|uniref:SGNH domain-containing protein n=1 Tax=Capitella teleta TaxID=283909 RepID=R7T7B5_CAPTE|nr:hypothetical protein CAPTEDRAFT_189849 [Capitella teleta]|eukprot:ELT87295.1 hypothetical protein CAPTEDRAFT_189849 [Capitella teleta]